MDHVANIARATGRSPATVRSVLRSLGFGISWAEEAKRLRAFVDAVNQSSIRLR